MSLMLIAHAAAALILALLAGVFLAFSDFIMRSLRAASPPAGIEAMQEMNRKVYRSVFLSGFLVMVPVSLILIAHAFAYLDGAARSWVVAGGAIYLGGTFLVTMLGNVPMNQRLDDMAPQSQATLSYWRRYDVGWTRFNHVRTISAGLASACLMMGSLSLA